ncbi:MAG: hypothetical protein ACI88Z_001701, partial [Sphingobacteriales bacterium]
ALGSKISFIKIPFIKTPFFKIATNLPNVDRSKPFLVPYSIKKMP